MYLLIFFVFFFYSLFHFTVFVAGLFLFLVFLFFSFFFFFFSSSTLPSSFLFSFLSFFSRQSVHLFVARLFLFFFLFNSFNSSIFLCPFRWCRVVMLKTVVYDNQVRSESLKKTLLDRHQINICHIVICWFMQKYTYICWIHTDAIINKTHDDKDTGTNDARRKTLKDAERLLYKIFYLSSLFVSFERVVQSLRVRGSWRPNITEIFWPQSYGRQRCVFLVLHGCSTGSWSKLFCVLAFPTTLRLPPSSTVLLALLLAYLQLSSIRRPYITFKLPRSTIDTPQRLRNLFRFQATGMCHFR